MERGDISNGMSPRIIVVANDMLLDGPKFNPLKAYRWKKRHWHTLVDETVVVPEVRNWLHDFTWRRQYRVDVVVIGVNAWFCERLSERFSRMNLAIANVYPVRDVQELVNSLAYMPEVLYIAHGFHDERRWAFGPRGVYGTAGLASIP